MGLGVLCVYICFNVSDSSQTPPAASPDRRSHGMLSVPNTQLVNMTPKTSTFTFFSDLAEVIPQVLQRNREGFTKESSWVFFPFLELLLLVWNKRHREQAIETDELNTRVGGEP